MEAIELFIVFLHHLELSGTILKLVSIVENFQELKKIINCQSLTLYQKSLSK